MRVSGFPHDSVERKGGDKRAALVQFFDPRGCGFHITEGAIEGILCVGMLSSHIENSTFQKLPPLFRGNAN